MRFTRIINPFFRFRSNSIPDIEAERNLSREDTRCPVGHRPANFPGGPARTLRGVSAMQGTGSCHGSRAPEKDNLPRRSLFREPPFLDCVRTLCQVIECERNLFRYEAMGMKK